MPRKATRIKDDNPLNLDEIFEACYAIKRQREKEKPRNIEIWFPSEKAMNQFLGWMKSKDPAAELLKL